MPYILYVGVPIIPFNGQTTSNHTKLSTPSRSPLDFGVHMPLDMSNLLDASPHTTKSCLLVHAWFNQNLMKRIPFELDFNCDEESIYRKK
jgi:hypothetical protein